MKKSLLSGMKKASLLSIVAILTGIALVIPVFADETDAAQEQTHRLPAFVKADVDVAAVFADGKAQKLTLPEDRMINGVEEELIDTIWIYYTDNTFDQYAQTPKGYELFSTGTYSFNEGSDFIADENGEDDIITINRTQRFDYGDNGPGLYDCSSSHEYNLAATDFGQLYAAGDDDRKIEAIMGDDNELFYKDENGVVYHYDSIWIMFDDMSFSQFAFIDKDVELFASGSYEFDETGDFRLIGREENSGKITLTYDYNKRMEDAGIEDMEPVTFDLKSLGLTYYYEKAVSEPAEDADEAKEQADDSDKASADDTKAPSDDTDEPKDTDELKDTTDDTGKTADDTKEPSDEAKEPAEDTDKAEADDTGKADSDTADTDEKSSEVIDEELETVLSDIADEYGFTDEERDLFVEFATSIFSLMESEEANAGLEVFKSNISDYYSDETVAQITEALQSFDYGHSGLEDAWDEIMQDYQYIVTKELSAAYDDIQETVIKEAKKTIPAQANIPKAEAREIEQMSEDMAELISASVMYNLSDMFSVFDILSEDGDFSLNENVEAFRDANTISEEDIQAKIDEYNALKEAHPEIAKNEARIINKVNETINDEFAEAFSNIKEIMKEDVDEILEGYNVSKADKKMIVNMLLSMFDQINEEFEQGLKENTAVDQIISGKQE